MIDKPLSVFDNEQFVNGFIEFYASAQFEKYMLPFLKELIETHRDRLEGAADPVKWQNRLQSIRYIANMADILKVDKSMKAREQSES